MNRKRKQKKEEKLKGDKLRDLILLVHLNNKYGKGKNEIPALKEILGYSTGGIYNALDSSGYFRRTPDKIFLTEKGEQYLNTKILPQYNTSNSVGNMLIILGFVFILQWVEWTYLQFPLILPWYSGLAVIFAGLFLRFFVLRFNYWIIKRKRKMVTV